jgi:hypothetical protein
MRSRQGIAHSDFVGGTHFEQSCSRLSQRRFSTVLWLVVAGLYVSYGQWGHMRSWLVGALFLAFLAWFAVKSLARLHRDPGGGSGMADAGKPAPVRPDPTHHLGAAKDLPPSDKTHSLPHD